MFNTFLKNRARTLTTILILSILLTAATVFAAIEFITVAEGGSVSIAKGVELVIVPNGLADDANVLGEMYEDEDGNLSFVFMAYKNTPNNSVALTKPALLYVSRSVIKGLKDTILYGDNGEEIVPEKSGNELKYSLDHFSLYYYRRR